MKTECSSKFAAIYHAYRRGWYVIKITGDLEQTWSGPYRSFREADRMAKMMNRHEEDN